MRHSRVYHPASLHSTMPKVVYLWLVLNWGGWHFGTSIKINLEFSDESSSRYNDVDIISIGGPKHNQISAYFRSCYPNLPLYFKYDQDRTVVINTRERHVVYRQFQKTEVVISVLLPESQTLTAQMEVLFFLLREPIPMDWLLRGNCSLRVSFQNWLKKLAKHYTGKYW